MRTKLTKAYRLSRKRRLRRSAPILLKGLLSYLVEREIVHVMEKRLDEAPSGPPKTGFELFEADAADVRRFIALTDEKDLQRRAECYLQNGYRRLLGVVDGVTAGQFWWVDATETGDRRHPHLERLQLRLGSRDAYGFDFYVLPSARGRGTGTAIFAGAAAYLRAKGYERLLGFVDDGNVPARWLHNVSGYRVVRTVRSLRLVRWILVSEKRVFVLNSRWSRPHGWDYRPLWPRRVSSGESGKKLRA